MSPSKLHGSLGMGTPIVYVGPDGSNVSEAIDAYDCGVSIRTDDVAALVDAIRGWKREPARRERAARQARVAFEERYCDVATLPRWDGLLD
jgi:glycosyltransferase involved in cell wall biosynthesis